MHEKGMERRKEERKYERLPTFATMIRTSICNAHKYYRQLSKWDGIPNCKPYPSSCSVSIFSTAWAPVSFVILCNNWNVCWNNFSKNSSNSTGTQFLESNSFIHDIARIPAKNKGKLYFFFFLFYQPHIYINNCDF